MKDKIVEILEEFKVFEKTLDDNTEINSAIDHHKMALYKARRILAEQIAHLYSAEEEVNDDSIGQIVQRIAYTQLSEDQSDDFIEKVWLLKEWLQKLTRHTVSEEEIYKTWRIFSDTLMDNGSEDCGDYMSKEAFFAAIKELLNR